MIVDIIKAIIMGIIEGVTEWLPISSTGHMILAEQFLKFDLTGEFMSMFRVVIQLGAILAVVVLYWNELWPFCRAQSGKTGIAKISKPGAWHLWALILVGTLPAVSGVLLDDWMDAHLYNFWVVAAMLIVYGVLFIVIESRHRRAEVDTVEDITFRQALLIGCGQVLAMVPGTSRSGATILVALLIGIARPAAAKFTFYLAIPTMAGASGLKLLKYLVRGGGFGGAEIVVLAVGTVVAFFVSLWALRFLVSYVKKHDFKVFGWYRIVLGAVVLLAGALGWIV